MSRAFDGPSTEASLAPLERREAVFLVLGRKRERGDTISTNELLTNPPNPDKNARTFGYWNVILGP
jgi:hypothetical protein